MAETPQGPPAATPQTPGSQPAPIEDSMQQLNITAPDKEVGPDGAYAQPQSQPQSYQQPQQMQQSALQQPIPQPAMPKPVQPPPQQKQQQMPHVPFTMADELQLKEGELPKWLKPTWTPTAEQQPNQYLPHNPYLIFVKPPKVVPQLQGQPPEQTRLIQQLLLKDAFNTYCVECGRSKSTHFNVTFGIFICEACAHVHWKTFNMNESYVKACFTECWDKHQLKVAQMFGNKSFFDFIKQYDIQRMGIAQKYKTIAVKYYRDRLNFEVLGGMDPIFASRPLPPIAQGRLTKKQMNAPATHQSAPPMMGYQGQPMPAQQPTTPRRAIHE